MQFRLIHTLTGLALHSHEKTHPQYTSGQQEITGFPNRDANDFWKVERLSGPIVLSSFRSDSKATQWLSVVNLAGSIASITGITLLFLGTSLKTASFVRVVSTVFTASLCLGVMMAAALLLLDAHRQVNLKARSRGWLVPIWTIGSMVALAVTLYIWWGSIAFASSQLEPLLKNLFGER